MPKFAVVQMESAAGELEANFGRTAEHLAKSADQGAQVVVFPEVALTGYDLTPELAAEVADSIPGKWTDRMAEQCARLGVLACFGLVERADDGLLYNAAALVGSEGLIGSYRKIHLPFMGADRHLTPGDGLSGPFETPHGRLGIQICFDLRFPETTRALALRGAQVVLVPTALPVAATIFPEVYNRARSAENRIYIVSANHIGQEGGANYLGRSQISAPDGAVLAEAGPNEETILCAEVDLAEADRKKLVLRPGEYELDLFGGRRPELYGDLIDRSSNK
jgi:predicted amidohydrolase